MKPQDLLAHYHSKVRLKNERLRQGFAYFPGSHLFPATMGF